MTYSLEIILFILLLIDAIFANLFAWIGGKNWGLKHCRLFCRFFPAAKGWTTYYLVLVLFIGWILYRYGAF